MKKFITASLIISMLFGVTASAAWVFEETIIQIPEGINDININGNVIETGNDFHIVHSGEDIFRYYEGPTYIYENCSLAKVTPSPKPVSSVAVSTPKPTPSPTLKATPKPWTDIADIEGTNYKISRREGNEYRITDKNGRVVLPKNGYYIYAGTGTGLNGETLVTVKTEEKAILLNSKLKTIVDNNYTSIVIEKNGLIKVCRGEEYTYLNRNHEEIAEIGGEYKAHYGNDELNNDTKFYMIYKDDYVFEALIDDEANISEWYSDIDVVYGDFIIKHTSGEFTAMKSDGTWVSEKYKKIARNAQEWHCFSDEHYDKYDKDGNLIWRVDADWEIEDITGFEDVYTAKKDEKYAFMDKNGKLLTDFIYDKIAHSKDTITDGSIDVECVLVCIDNKYKFVDLNFNEYDAQSCIWYQKGWGVDLGDTRIVYLNGKYGLIDKNTKSYIIPYGDARIKLCGDYKVKDGEVTECKKHILYTLDGKTSVMDIYGNILYEFDEEIIRFRDWSNGFAEFTDKNARKFVLDENNEEVFDGRYDYLSSFIDDNTFLAQSGEELIVYKKLENPVAVNTDIRTSINGFEIPCYSVNDHNVIVAEDLGGYGFDVVWNSEDFTLNITRNPEYYEVNPVEIPEKQQTGSYYSDIIPNDVKVYFNGKRIGAYSIDGRMLIMPKDLLADGISYEYNNDDRMLYMHVDGLEQK